MCGILALCHTSHASTLGHQAEGLMALMAYRGRGAGALRFTEGEPPWLQHQVGPSDAALATLGLASQSGTRLLGHIAWRPEDLTPCLVNCRRALAGVVHGRLTNADVLRPLLATQSHKIQRVTPGDVITHLMEDRLLHAAPPPDASFPPEAHRMVEAARAMVDKAQGVFAAAFAEPQGKGVVAVAAGITLHAGLGKDEQGTFVVVSTELGAVLATTRHLIPMGPRQGIWTDGRTYGVFSLDTPTPPCSPCPEHPRMTAEDAALPRPFHSRLAQACAQVPARLEALALACTRQEHAAPFLEVFGGRRDLSHALASRTRALREAMDTPDLLAALQALRMDPAHRELMARLRPHLALIRQDGWPPRSDHRAIIHTLAGLAPEALDELMAWDQLLRWTVLDTMGQESAALAETIRRGGRVYVLGEGAFHHAAEAAAWALGRMAGATALALTPTAFKATHFRSLAPDDLLVLLAPRGLTNQAPLLREVRERAPSLRRVVVSGAMHDIRDPEIAETYLPLAFGPQAPGAPDAAFLALVSLMRALAARAAGGDAQARRVLAMDRRAAESLPRFAGADLERLADRCLSFPCLHVLYGDSPGPARAGARLLAATARFQAAAEDLDAFLDGPLTALQRAPQPLLLLCPPQGEARQRVMAALDPLVQRGAEVYVMAEPDRQLKDHLAELHPDPTGRDTHFITLPETGDPDAFTLTSALALQLLALHMTQRRVAALERDGTFDHGLHPDGDGSAPGSTAPCPPAIW